MTTLQQREEPEPQPRYYSDPDEALRNARPLPPREIREVEGVDPELWDAFYEAISRS